MNGKLTRRPSLDDYDLSKIDEYQNTGSRVFPRDMKGGASHVTSRDVLGGGACWCGESAFHDWPGKTDGAPHPRDGGAT